jgi:hypothetical protein
MGDGNRVSIVVGSQDNSKLDLDSLKRKLTDMGRMIETARVDVRGDREASLAVERMALKLARLGRAAASPRIGLEGAARAEVEIEAVSLSLDKLGGKAATAEVKVGRSGSGLSGALSGLGKALGGMGGAAGGALGVGLSAPFAAAGLAVAGFGALAEPTLSKVSAAMGKTGKAGQLAYKQLDPQQQGIFGSLRQLQGSFDGLAKRFEPVTASVVKMAAGFATSLMPAMAQLAPAGAKVIGAVLTPMTKLFASPFFASFIRQMSQLATQVAPMLGLQLTRLLVVFMQMFMQAGPAAVQVLNLLIPAIVDIASGLIPVVAAVTKMVAVTVEWLAKNHLLIPALAAVGVALAVAFGGFPLIVTAIALVAGGLVHLWQTSQTFRNIVTGVFSVVGRAVLTFAELWLDELHIVTNIWLTAVGIIVHGAAAALGWVPGVGPALKLAVRGFDAFRDGVNNVFNAAHSKIEQWKANLANMPKVVHLQGDINDLTAKLNAAKRQLADPHLTATRRSAIITNIGQLELAIARARAELAAINGTTATTYVQTIQLQPHGTVPGGRVEHGGIIGAASGGIHSSLRLVGEHGAELVTLPPGAMVHSNPDTQRMLGAGGWGDLRIVVELGNSFREAGLSPAQMRDVKASVKHHGGGDVQAAFGN